MYDYNRFMGGVDRNDEMFVNYIFVRKSMKWIKKVVFYFIEEVVFNVYFLNKKFDNRKRYLKFKLDVILVFFVVGGIDIVVLVVIDRLLGRYFLEVIFFIFMK